jgi:ABC-type sugar transport system ATPase subunit
MTSSGPALVEMTGVEKRFGTTRALRGVDLTLSAGECLGLVGRNGAGKSTIVSILSGLAEPDAGQVRFAGEPAPRVGDIARWREWIATVFQHSMIVGDLSVAENVFLGDMARVLSWRELRARTREIMSDWGFDIPAEARCRELSVEQLQIVEIARALARGAKCVLLDEPTAALEREAVRRLFERVRQRPGRRAAAAAPITSRLSLVSSGPGQPVEELSGGNQQKITVARTLAHEPSLIVAIAVICDRVIVLVRGQVFAEFAEPPFDRDELIVATEGLSGTSLDTAYETPAHDTPKEAAE